MKPLCFGAAGVIWALDRLTGLGVIPAGPDYLPSVIELARRHREDLRANPQVGQYMSDGLASYLIGEVGMQMLQWQMQPSDAIGDAIHAGLQQKIGDGRGLLWGAAGSMIAAVLMHQRTNDPRWAELFVAHFEALWNKWVWTDDAQCWIWTDELYGVTETRLGALHGFVANAHAIVRGAHLLSRDRRHAAIQRIVQTLLRTALVDERYVNWPHTVQANSAMSNRARTRPLVQFCSGAPGVVACMTGLAADTSERLESLLVAAGEFIWGVGPTTKFPVLCHGVVGSGYAFLKLYARTGDQKWLERARAFAMHGVDAAQRAVAQYGQRKYSLWTGDLGLAVFLWDCVVGDARLPTLEVF